MEYATDLLMLGVLLGLLTRGLGLTAAARLDRFGGFGLDLALDTAFGETGCLTNTVTQEVKLRATNNRAANDLDTSDLRGMEGELSLDALTVDNTADDEHFAGSAARTGDDDTVKDLNTFFVAFEDLAVNIDGVADGELGNLRLAAEVFDLLENLLTHRKTRFFP